MPITPAWTPLDYHEQQSRMWRDPVRFKIVVAGRGSGKTEVARRRTARYLPVEKLWADPMYFYALPTYGQAKRVAWNKILQLVPDSWIAKRSDSDLMIQTVFGSRLFVVGMDKPQRIEGDQWDGGVIDESSDTRPDAFHLSVLPALTHRHGWCWRIGVPKRSGIGAVTFRRDFEAASRNELPDTKAYWWPSSDILSEQELALHRANLDPKGYREQYEASWESAGGGVFYCFSRALYPDGNVSTDAVYRRDQPIVVGNDFNINPMAWTLSHQVGEEYHTFDELFIGDCNTRDALDWVAAKYGSHEAGWLFIGDATGKARKTSASTSDYQQILSDQRFPKKRVWYPKGNPKRADRFAACNTLLLTAAGKRRAKIHPRCAHLINDMEVRAYVHGSTDTADSGDIGHVSDAWGYPVFALYPILRGTGESRVAA